MPIARFALLLASLLFVRPASASGPVERMVQVLLDPSDPNVLVVRWAMASEGYLISRDGGRSFAALCSAAISPREPIRRISGQTIPSAAATLIDGQGHLMLTQLDGVWSDDGSGCTWHKELDGSWPHALLRDPASSDVLAIVNKLDNSDPKNLKAEARVLRRTADGQWSPFESAGPLRKPRPNQRVYGNELIGAKTARGTRLYASMLVSEGPLTRANLNGDLFVAASDDGGKSWTQGKALPAAYRDGFVLLGADPLDERHLVGAVYREGASDSLLVSEDAGASFHEYATLHEIVGVSFAADGRLFVGDAGAGSEDAQGGLYRSARLGLPLAKVEGTAFLDCLTWSEAKQTLYACRGDQVGTLDANDGSFVRMARAEEVPALLSCPGADIGALCQEQLNRGPSWCCAGHYPFTAFCDQYDVKDVGGRHVFCGKSGQDYDRAAGRVPEVGAVADAGVSSDVYDGEPDAVLDEPEGCSGSRLTGAVIILGLLAGLRFWSKRGNRE